MSPRVQPIIPTRRKEPFDDPDWLFDFKYDGFRALCYIEQGGCLFISRNGNVLRRFEALGEQVAAVLNELNAMTSRQLVDFIEAALAAHGVDKVVPDGEVIRQLQALIAQLTARANNEHDAAEVPGSPSARRFETHARHHLETKLASELIAHHAEDIARRAAAAELPADLVIQVYRLLTSLPASEERAGIVLGSGARPDHRLMEYLVAS